MAKKTTSLDLRLMSKVSRMYYNQDYNQQEIADRLHISRPKVSRLLKQAREQGIVQISVSSPGDNFFVESESALEEKYGLKEVLLIESDTQMPSQTIKREIGSAAANYLLRTVTDGDVIGVTWGTTLQAMIDSLQPKHVEDVHVVQTLGGVGPPEAKAHATDISRRLSQLLNGRLTLLPAPGIVDSTEARSVLLSDRRVKKALQLFSEINIAFVGIGALHTNLVLKKESTEMSTEIQQEILKSNAVGDIGLNFFDSEGNIVKTSFQKQFIGMTLDELNKVKTVVGIAGGKEKFDAIKGALKGGYINVLITDQHTGNSLIKD